MRKYIKDYIALPLILLQLSLMAQEDSLRQDRIKPLAIASGTAYISSMVALNALWYSDYERESFHFFNDSREWKQMDKLGHGYSAFHISSGGYHTLRWAGLQPGKALICGSLSSVIFLTSIEIFDGFSSAYGASWSDVAANTTGTLLFYAQQKVWNEVRIHPKFSYRKSDLAPLRPEVLGSNTPERLLKDYNAQTYWLSFDISRFAPTFPKWLNIGLGYSADNMIYAEDKANTQIGLSPVRQYFIGIDLDVSEIKTKSAFLNTLLYAINMIHIPAPAIELSGAEFKFHYIY